MMDKLFLQVLNMSITSSYIILFIMVARLLLKKVPKVFSYALWVVAFLRLIIPFSLENVFSLVPVNTKTVPMDIMYSQTPHIKSGITIIDRAAEGSLPTPMPGASMNPMQLWIFLGRTVWLLGAIILVVYSLFTAVKLYKKLKPAKLFKGNIYEMEGIKTPFIFGLIRPRIYLPTGLSEKERAYIIAHERIHIKRYDHIIKIIAFLAVCIHWFNPLVWVAYFLMGGDMELSCDERVIKEMGIAIKKDYSTSLLTLSTGRRIIGGCPLAFGENNTKGRIKNILNYKKPKFWVIVTAIIIVAVICIGLMGSPQKPKFADGNNGNGDVGNETQNKQITVEDYANQFIEQEIKSLSNEIWQIIEHKITRLEKVASFDDVLPDLVEMWALEYRLKPDDINKVTFAGGMAEEDGWITEDHSMGKPMLVFSYSGLQPTYLGVIYGGVAEITGMDLNSIPGREMALRVLLESEGILPQETYAGEHVLVKFPLSTGETCQLLLSQPALKGSHGIWCVERWMDGSGNIYYVIPKTDGRIKDYFEGLQQEVDAGHRPGLMDPAQVALHWINDDLGQFALLEELDIKHSVPAEDFLKTPESRYLGFIDNFTTDEYPKPYFHLYPVEWLTYDDGERLEELGVNPDEDMPNGFYIHQTHEYPLYFQATEDTRYNIIDWGEEISHKPVTAEEFEGHLKLYSGFTPPFHIVTKDGYVQEITEQYVP